MLQRLPLLIALVALVAGPVFAQGLTTTATRDDWEEINFEFNSSILSDGYPSLLRIAELLAKNPTYRVRVEGHTDWVGSHPFNDKLAMARANTVKAFLEKYGASAGQITIGGQGERTPKVDNKTKEGRFMNRRVTLQVTDGQGRVIGAGGAPEAIKAMEAAAKQQEECCSQILKRLEKLDEILALLKDLKDDNARLRKDLEDLRGRQTAAAPPAPPAPPPGPSPAQISDLVEKATTRALEQARTPRFSLLGLNAGLDDTKNLTFTGRGQFFAPFKENFAFQAQGEYMYFRTRKEGQLDFGLVSRYKPIQLGAFASFRNISWKEWQNTATLGQAAFTLDYVFKLGRVGLFGTKGFMDKGVVNRVATSTTFNVWQETYLGIVDQVGASAAVGLSRRAWLEGNIGYLRGYSGLEKPGGTLRFVFPLSNRFAFTAEGGFNETLVQRDSNGRATFGILFGNFMNPRDYAGVEHPVPVDIPRVRYEVLTRTVRTGNSPPVAIVQDQIGVQAGTINLDGSDSHDPDGDPLTFEWTQVAGPAVTLSSRNTAQTSFTAADGQVYGFRLLVRDSLGAQGIARVTVSTREAPRVRILRFVASPLVIEPGAQSTLNYLVENATSVTISGVSTALNPQSGTAQVRPEETTTYTLTARNAVSEETAIVTVVVNRQPPRFLSCAASPVSIRAGETATLSWSAQNATAVEIPGVGSFGATGSTPVTPTASTTYTIIARNPEGEATCTVSVLVQQTGGGNLPRIVTFTANPMEVVAGTPSTLTWNVTGADTVTISQGIGTVDPTGSRPVTPTTTTTYTLTATNPTGSVTADATVTVVAPVRIIRFTVDPASITRPGQPITLTWETENATGLFIDQGVGPRPVNGSLTTAGPIRTQTYTLTAVGRGSTATAQVTVTLTSGPPDGGNQTPVARVGIGGDIVTSFRDLILDASPSFDADNDPLTFSWRSVDGKAVVVTPNAARAQVRLKETFYGDFLFEVTVADSKGASSKANVRVTLVQARPLF
jgi:hypothetical protein